MKISSIIGSIIFAILPGVQVQVGAQSGVVCKGKLGTRVEIRSLPKAALSQMIATLQEVQGLGWLNWYSFVHAASAGSIHNVPAFLPWHRKFARDFELTMQHYQPSFMLPYWDAAIDSVNPANSAVFQPAYFGGDGVGSNKCVGSGPMQNWVVEFPNNRCLRRQFDNGNGRIKSWATPELITSDIQMAKDYDDFRRRIEYGIHGQVHNAIGGDMVTMNSPNDFLFFLHHANIDRLWWKWQNLKIKNLLDYGGIKEDKRTNALLDDQIAYYGIQVNEAMVLGYGDMCFGYDDVSALQPDPASREFRSFISADNNERSAQEFDSDTTIKAEIGKILQNNPATNPYHDKKEPVSTENAKPLLPENQLGSSGISTSVSDLVQVLKVPDMSIASALSKSTVSKFFPLLNSFPVSMLSVELPAVVAPNAVSFAKAYNELQQQVKQETADSNINDTSANILKTPSNGLVMTMMVPHIPFLQATDSELSAMETEGAQVPKIELGSDEEVKETGSNLFASHLANAANAANVANGNGVGKELQPGLKKRDSSGAGDDAAGDDAAGDDAAGDDAAGDDAAGDDAGPSHNTGERILEDRKFQIPKPPRLSTSFMEMNHIDPADYEIYYQEKIELVNALNDEGYISPYV